MAKRSAEIPPNPATLITALRDIGYSFDTAVADIIDNSITANAKRIDIRSSWNRGRPYVAVVDDGVGMDEATLLSAMKFGSKDPLLEREASDLGRFGLGLKTASISQCKMLTVLSRHKGVWTCAVWDIDYICSQETPRWEVQLDDSQAKWSNTVLQKLADDYLVSKKSGTIVLWQSMDRMEKNENVESFDAIVSNLKGHLGLTFHRYLESESSKPAIKLFVNGRAVAPFNPFNGMSFSAQELPEETLHVEGEEIRAQAFVLPHHSMVSKDEYERYQGTDGYRCNQGFYIYRNRRLIIKGTWFHLKPRAELTKLVRIRVDIPNSLDHIWKIDVRKSSADLPEMLKKQLRKVMPEALNRGTKTYTMRGYKIQNKVLSPLWQRKVEGVSVSYTINRSNFVLKEIKAGLSKEAAKQLDDYLVLLESRLPKDQLFADISEHPKDIVEQEIPDLVLEFQLDRFIKARSKLTKGELVTEVLATDPFCVKEEVVKRMLRERGYQA